MKPSYIRRRIVLQFFLWFFFFGLFPMVLPDQNQDRLTISGFHLRVAVAQVLKLIFKNTY